jgi:DNA-binding transcriptional MerR regulator
MPTIRDASDASGWSPRMLRYLEENGVVAPSRTAARYRLYSDVDISLLRRLAALRARFGFALTDVAFAVRLRKEPLLRRELGRWLDDTHGADRTAWLDWEQRKHAQLLAA